MMGWWQIHPHYHAKLSLLNKLVMSSMSSLQSSATAAAQPPLLSLLLPQKYLPTSKGHSGELMTQCLQSTLRSPRWKVFYNPLLACPACVNKEVREASGAGPGGAFSRPELLGGARVARAGMLEVWDNPALYWWEPGSNINWAAGC